jgi:hypothetical protein
MLKIMPNARLLYANCSDAFYSTMFPKEEMNTRALSLPSSANQSQEVVVYHGTTCDAFPRDRSKDSSLRVGRYMFEKDDYLLVKKRSKQKRDFDRILGCCEYNMVILYS